MDILFTFAQRLKSLMKEEPVNAEELGRRIGVAPSVIRRWCLSRNIRMDGLVKLANYFECSLEYLCGRIEFDFKYEPKSLPPFMEWLPKVMKESHKSTYKLYNETRIKSPYFTLWRNGGQPQLSSLGVLADYLEVTIDHLVGRER